MVQDAVGNVGMDAKTLHQRGAGTAQVMGRPFLVAGQHQRVTSRTTLLEWLPGLGILHLTARNLLGCRLHAHMVGIVPVREAPLAVAGDGFQRLELALGKVGQGYGRESS